VTRSQVESSRARLNPSAAVYSAASLFLYEQLASRAGAAQQFLRGKPTSRLRQICYCRPHHRPRTSHRSVIRSATATAILPSPIQSRTRVRRQELVTIPLSIFGAPLIPLQHPQHLRRPHLRIAGSRTGRGATTLLRRCAKGRRLSFACVHHNLDPSVWALFFN
jgi:hypothetical protein